MKPRVVYLATDMTNYKIGVTGDIRRRERELSNASGRNVSVLNFAEVDGALALERRLHAAFVDKRLHGEWFSLDEMDVMSVEFAMMLFVYLPEDEAMEAINDVLPSPQVDAVA